MILHRIREKKRRRKRKTRRRKNKYSSNINIRLAYKSVSLDPSPPTTSMPGGGANEVDTTNDIEEDPPDEPTAGVELDLGSDNVEDSGGVGMWHPIKDYLFIAAAVAISFVVV
mmetsp:Transcript_38607/g.43241  ORF Transcript_38607/g.43241 Transcript_38607/m.43241 type:complete len:113 (-) Transcript_38607:933-1271(-)